MRVWESGWDRFEFLCNTMLMTRNRDFTDKSKRIMAQRIWYVCCDHYGTSFAWWYSPTPGRYLSCEQVSRCESI